MDVVIDNIDLISQNYDAHLWTNSVEGSECVLLWKFMLGTREEKWINPLEGIESALYYSYD